LALEACCHPPAQDRLDRADERGSDGASGEPRYERDYRDRS